MYPFPGETAALSASSQLFVSQKVDKASNTKRNALDSYKKCHENYKDNQIQSWHNRASIETMPILCIVRLFFSNNNLNMLIRSMQICGL